MAKILAVDASEQLLDLFSLALKTHGHEVKVANSKAELCKNLEEFSPDLILLEIWLNGDDGREICNNLKENGLKSPVILMSTNRDLLNNFSMYHADDVLEKPFEIATVYQKIDTLLA